jgi:hypothetical protein
MVNYRFSYASAVTIIIIFVANACVQDRGHLFPEGNHIPGLVGTLSLQTDETEIRLDNIFRLSALPLIDSFTVHPSLRARLSSDKTVLFLKRRNLHVPLLSEMVVWAADVPYSFLLRRSEKEAHTFRFDPQGKKLRSVMISGDMTNWEPAPMAMVDGKWQITLMISPGQYNYSLIVNGQVMPDPANKTIDGTEYSSIKIGSIHTPNTPRVVTKDFYGNILVLELENQPEEIFVLWQNFRLPPENIEREGRMLMVKIPRDAKNQELSFLRVVITDRNIIGNELLIPLHRGSAKF